MPATRIRYLVLLLLALAPACAYLTRVMSAANTTIAAELKASDADMGGVMAGFALGYFIFQVPGGFVASNWGVRKTLPLISVVWSLCAIWGSFAGSIDELWRSRVAMGVTQAALVPCCAQAISNWFPVARRGIASSVMGGSMQLGGILATQLTAVLLGPLGWRGALQAYAATGIVWAVPFALFFRERPEYHPAVNAEERELIEAGRIANAPAESATAISDSALETGIDLVVRMASTISIWFFLLQAVFRAYAYEFFTTWCPAFLEKRFELSKVAAASLTAWPLWAFGIGSLVGGYLVDRILQATGNRWLSRSGSACFGLSVCAVCFAVATTLDDSRLTMAVIACGALFASVGGPATWAAAMDLGGRRAAVLAGTMNMMGNIGAYYCPKHVGMLFQSIENTSGNWDLVLWLFAGVNLACALSWLCVNSRRAVLDA